MTLLHTGAGGPNWLDWGLQPDVLALCLVLGLGYFYSVTRLRPRISDAGRVKRSQALAFAFGVVTIYAASGSPLHDLADEYLVSAHMLQHVLLALVAAPLLIVGTPVWLWQALLRRPVVLPAVRLVTHPVVALAVFNGVLLLTHLPSTIDFQVQAAWFHFLMHAALLASGLVLWWPVLSEMPEAPRLSYPLQIGYLFLQSMLPAVLASFVTFADRVVYPFYAEAPRIWGISATEDQQIGGLVMKLLGTAIIWWFIAVAFFKWYAGEEAKARGPQWEDVEEELGRLGLTEK